MKKIIIVLSFFIFTSANAGMSDKDKSKAWDCVGIYMAYGSKYDKAKTDKCHTFVEALVPNGAERVKKVVQTLY